MREPLPSAGDGLQLSRDAEAVGLHARFLAARHGGQLTPLRRGVYISSERAAEMTAVDRYRASVLAVGHQRRRPVFAGLSAAVLWGLPVVRPIPNEVYLLAPGTSGRRRNGVVEFARRAGVLLDEHNGLVLTALADTLIDVARTMPFLTAMVMVDAALHRPRFGGIPPLCTEAELIDAYERRLPFPGSARVLAVLERRTTLVESVLETVSRVHVEQLGFPAPVLQYPVALPRTGRTVYLDTAWPEHGVWGEADGDGKYLGDTRSGRDPRDIAAIMLAEKRRENDVRAVTRWNCARWGWDEAWRLSQLRALLLEAGLPLIRGPRPTAEPPVRRRR